MEKQEKSSRVLIWITRIGTGIEKATGFVCVMLFAFMVITALLGVFFRYVMNNPFQWTEEVARYTLIWLGFTAINMAIWRQEHISIPFVLRKLPGKISKILSVAGHLFIAVYLYVLLIKGYHMTANTMTTAQSMPISMLWFYLAVPVSALLSLAQTTLSAIRIILSPSGTPVLTRE